LRKWADILLIAPLSANTLAKITHGICDNLLTLIIRCWDLRKDEKNRLIKKIIICPSMNSYMWINPIS
jgi:phosphopantothenoylcysteine decarboxylase